MEWIPVLVIAVLALIVVKALAESPWGVFTVCSTVPIALFMGIYMRFLRPGRVGEVSVIGIVLLVASIWFGGVIAHDPYWGPALTFKDTTITFTLIGYAFISALLPVWLILAPRDYLATFLKIGVIVGLALGIVILNPDLKMPAVTQYIDGTGPLWKGALFPFLFITIACGAVSGFHALIASGTTPKLLANETDARFIGYGAMLMESFVAVMALVAASIIEPGLYFAMNTPPAGLGIVMPNLHEMGGENAAMIAAQLKEVTVHAAATVSSWGFVISPEQILQTAKDIGEPSVLNRAGGAPTLAVGIAHVFHKIIPMADMGFWYHFGILFEALFILTALDAGTRAGRFMLQDLLGVISPGLKKTSSLPANLLATALCVLAWGYFLHQGVVDPLGGINTLWPLFGIANQMLAGMALSTAFTMLLMMLQASGDPRMAQILTWISGSTYSATPERVVRSGAVMLALLALAPLCRRWLTILPLGGEAARAVGMALTSSRIVLLLLAACLTAAATLTIGPLSFVGLMAPHIARMMGFRRTLPHMVISGLTGGLLLVFADWCGRMMMFPYQIPAGLLSTFIGAPYFIYLLRKQSR